MIQEGCKYWCIYDNKPMEYILIEVLEHCYKIQTQTGVGYTRQVFENIEEVVLYLKSLPTNVTLMSSLQRIAEGRMEKYIEDKERKVVNKDVTESLTMDFELCKKYITEFVIELSEGVIKGLEFNKNTRL